MNCFSLGKRIEASVVKGPASPTFSRSGNQISSGKNTKRVHFNIFSNNTCFDVKCYDSPKPLTFKIKISSGTVFLNGDDCKRLHLTKKQLNESSFNELWDQREPDFKALVNTIHIFSNSIKNYNEDLDPNYLNSKEMADLPFPPLKFENLSFEERCEIEEEEKALAKKREAEKLPPISKKALMKIIHTFCKTFETKIQTLPLPLTFPIKFKAKTIEKYKLHNNMTKLITHINTEGDCYIFNKHKIAIASGRNGKVFKVQNILTSKYAALKQSKVSRAEKAIPDMEKEIENLKTLNEICTTDAIQGPYYFSVKQNFPKKKISSYSEFYNGIDLFEIRRYILPSDRLKYFESGFNKLIITLDELHENNFFNSDIKPENIFVKVDENANVDLFFGDLGGLRQSQYTFQKHNIITHTPAYSPFEPYYEFEYEPSTLKAFDIFQLGSTFVECITGLPAYQINDSDDYPDFQNRFQIDILSEFCSDEALTLLENMCRPDELCRFTAAQAKEWINKPGFCWRKT